MHLTSFLLASCLLLLTTYRSDAQQIDLGTGDIDFLALPFHQDFIRNNSIAEITVEEQIKRSNQSIRPSGLKKIYSFNTDGRCTERSTYRQRYGRTDTIFEAYRLSPSDMVVQYDRKDRGGFYREAFEKHGDTLTICSFRGKTREELATWMGCEHQVTRRSGKSEEVTILNENMLPYRRRSREFNADGYLIRMVERYVVSQKMKTTTYTYNDRGRLSFRRRESDKGNEEWSYTYDDVDGALEEVLYRLNGELVWRRTIVQDDHGRIAAILTMDQATEDIIIEKFTYEFAP